MSDKPKWWPDNPYPKSVFPMERDMYSEIVPNEKTRTALSGMLGREFWDIASETIWDAVEVEIEQLQAENEHLCESVKAMDVLTEQIVELQESLDESIKFQTHYAELLNMYDGGKRIIFKNSEQWIKRLQALKGGE